MIAIRTPAKKAKSQEPQDKSPQEAGSPVKNSIRRSAGEVEASISQPPSSPSKTITKPKPATAMVINFGSPTAQNSKTAEARKSLLAVKKQLSISRNIKREIREEITIQVEKMFNLVKEAETESRQTPSARAVVTTGTKRSAAAPSPLPRSVLGSGVERVAETETASLRKVLEEHGKKLAESNEMMARLKEALQNSQENCEKVTYASAAASQSVHSQPHRQTALHTIAVTADDESKTGEEVLGSIREAVNAKGEWITVDRVRKTKNRKVLMSFSTKEEKEKVKERLQKNGTALTVEEVRNRDPLLILGDVLLVNTDQDVLRAIRNQNPTVFHGLNGEADRLEIKFRKRARNPHTGHIVLSASPMIWKRVVERGHLYIDLQRVRAKDHSPLIQCSLCLGYGHTRKICTETVEKCSHCGGPHFKNNCADWLAGLSPTCCNCTHAKLGRVDHNAFSMDCSIRQKWDKIARTAIAYC